ncbi:hypothetical protein EX30DRAFT_261099 [Ascodesmis nigricans]|uniref:Uncharacterized protein n=1 Tax=Ascodesmis nigricans TaxID=341454 RepID=A0A4S2MXL9_9PEZI|nr:hypothetical protein EX30DRAFT_261099 [Ascodesmis nigricans]
MANDGETRHQRPPSAIWATHHPPLFLYLFLYLSLLWCRSLLNNKPKHLCEVSIISLAGVHHFANWKEQGHNEYFISKDTFAAAGKQRGGARSRQCMSSLSSLNNFTLVSRACFEAANINNPI